MGQFFTTIAKNINLEAAGLQRQSVAQDKNFLDLRVSESLVKGVQTIAHTGDSEDTLEKGLFAECFEYMEKYNFPVRKTGKDIKKSLEKTIKFFDSELAKCKKLYESLLSKLNIKPKSNFSGYQLKGLEAKMPSIPKMFNYSDIDAHVSENKINYSESPLREYNDEVRKYVSLCIDKIYAETMMDGLEEDREYTLTIRQAAKL